MAETNGIFNVRAENYEWFNEQIAKLSKRSVRLLGAEFAITPVVLGYTDTKVKNRVKRVYQISLTAPEVKLTGWEFIAKLDHANEVGNIVRVVPGKVLPVSYRTADYTNCDHCHTRRYRRDTYVVRHVESNEFKQIGSSCLKDFLGHDVEKIAKLAEFLGYAGDIGESASEDRMVGGDLRYIHLGSYLGYVAAVVEKFGWLSRTAAKAANANAASDPFPPKEASADVASEAMQLTEHPRYYRGRRIEPSVKVADENRATADAAVEWAQNLTDEQVNRGDNDYLHNIRVIAASGVIEQRSTGLAASIVGSYLREMQKLKARVDLAASKFVGTVGERLDFGTVTVLGFTTHESGLGISHLYSFLTAEGNVIVWWASRHQGVVKGDTVNLTGTISKHDAYKNVNQTAIKRGKLVKATGEK